MRNIKKEYKKYVVLYFIIYIVVNLTIVIMKYNLINVQTISVLKENQYIIKPIYTIISLPVLSILGLVILNFMPSNIKEIIIFRKLNNVLPSYRWQKYIADKDNRINVKLLNKKYGKNLSEQKQHDLWYKAYQRCKSDEVILESQKEYLFSRDLCMTTVLIIPIIVIIYILGKVCLNLEIYFLIINIIILLLLYIILDIVSINSANRFICNVLLLDSSLENKK